MTTPKPLLLSLCSAAIFLAPPVQAASPGTGFTYQGRLFDGGAPANGLYDLRFTNFATATGGSALGSFNTNALPVTNGLFMVTLDFGAVFDGTPRWLEISERTNGAAPFATLAPRQLLAAAPYATYASSAGTASTVPGLTILQNTNGAPNVIAGSPWNWAASSVVGATISGGGATNYTSLGLGTNSVSADFGTIGGGQKNAIQDHAAAATIGGGQKNTIQTEGFDATIGGGGGNTIQYDGQGATISGGEENTIASFGLWSTIGGGYQNTIQTTANAPGGAGNGTIGGGLGNTILENAHCATIPGGFANSATNLAFAAGNMAQAVHNGAFVWADSTSANFSSTTNDQFAVRASGGVFFKLGDGNVTVQADDPSPYADGKQLVIQGSTNSNRQLELGYKIDDSQNWGTIQAIEQNTGVRPLILQPAGGNVGINKVHPTSALDVYGTVTATAFNPSSDRNLKENFDAVEPREILDQVASLAIWRWNFKADAATPHLGPMAQDFYAAFNVGSDDRHIATVDADGVALAAIQGLNQKLEEMRAENAALRARLEKLERLLPPPK